MQYLLTEDEYNQLVPKYRLTEAENKIRSLNRKVLELSNFRCREAYKSDDLYCDECPIGYNNIATCKSLNQKYKRV